MSYKYLGPVRWMNDASFALEYDFGGRTEWLVYNKNILVMECTARRWVDVLEFV